MKKLRIMAFVWAVAVIGSWSVCRGQSLQVGFGEADITPPAGAGHAPVYIAGYGQNRVAEGVHDPLYARAVVFGEGTRKIAFVCVDLIGLQYPQVIEARKRLDGFEYVMVSSSHNHEGPDVIGIWGASPLHCGVNAPYLEQVIEGIVKAVKAAEQAAQPAKASYGTANDESLLGDSRLPKVKDGVMRVLSFTHAQTGKRIGLLVQWSCHPEAMGPRNKLITADFPYATIAALKKKYQCDVALFTGAIGGLMAPPGELTDPASGRTVREGEWEHTELYGRLVADLAAKAIDDAKPISLWPPKVSAVKAYVPMVNPLYAVGRVTGVLKREAYVWQGDYRKRGEPAPPLVTDVVPAVETEVAYVRLGELHVACIPGEIYPELIYGQYQDPADPNADFPEAPLETPVAKILPGDKVMFVGLANDEIGYILPKRQWDIAAPYAYGRRTSQYGEINSVGPEAGPIVIQSLKDAVQASN